MMASEPPAPARPAAQPATPTARLAPAAAPAPALPKAPVLDWAWLALDGTSPLPRISDLPHRAFLTSGRAALRAALRQLALPAGSGVLVPTYHCPTMVAPVVAEGLRPLYFPIGADGLPLLDAIAPADAAAARVMFVAHYFGLARSLAAVRQWCSERGIVLVEDCAHAYFGWAGDQPVGSWGDFATASLSKFFPVREGGLLVSARRALRAPGLAAAPATQQLRAAVDILEHAHQHRRLQGVHQLGWPVFALKRRLRPEGAAAPAAGEPTLAPLAATDVEDAMRACDMGRTGQSCTWAARLVHRLTQPGRIVGARRRNFSALAAALDAAPGAQPLQRALPDGAAPYVLPLWIEGRERADRVYAHMRQAALPVFRWDTLWPATPVLPHDHGAAWSRQVLQLLCHQDLRPTDIDRVAQETLALLHDAPLRHA